MLLEEDGSPASHNVTTLSMPAAAPQNNEISIRNLDDLGGHHHNNPPSPLVTEADEDEGGPSSVEAQADPSDLSFDLDIDLPATSYPLVSPQPSTSNDIFNEPTNDDQNPFADLFTPTPALEPDVKVDGAIAGICGFYNFANTCYMNSGLQCLLATPTFVKYFTESFESSKDDTIALGLTAKFQPLLKDVWAGDYSLLKPLTFKECLSNTHPQFSGSHQHDCQEFLALLLGTMHEELRSLKGYCKNKSMQYESECGTSMELHTAHSTEKEAALSMSWLSRNSSLEDHTKFENAPKKSGSGPPSVINQNSNLELQDGSESRGSASPRSYDSRSSVEDKVAQTIRQLPIPKGLKVKNKPGSFSGGEDEDSQFGEDDYGIDEDDTMDSNSSSANQNQPTSNLVAPDSLKRQHQSSVRFSEEIEDHLGINNATATVTENKSPSLMNDFYQKENKTLNVNVLAEDSEEMNNEISFDSEKFSKTEAKSRPRGTIDNLTENICNDGMINSGKTSNNTKRIKNIEIPIEKSPDNSSNSVTAQCDMICDFNGIKRMRLDSSDKEKNIQLEMERQCSSSAVSCGASALEPSSPTLDPARLKEAIEADRYWEKYLAINDTVVARTFQGQFKSSVICRTCNYVSVSFEPFMYLPVPLPNAAIRQIQVTYIGVQDRPIQLLFDMSQSDNVGHLKSKLVQELNIDITAKIQIVEVLDHHISRVVDDWTMLKCLKDDRQIYGINVAELSTAEDKEEQQQQEPLNQENSNFTMDDVTRNLVPDLLGDFQVSSSTDIMKDEPDEDNWMNKSSNNFPSDPSGDRQVPEMPDGAVSSSNINTTTSNTAEVKTLEYQTCVICMEDLPGNELRQHNACDCVICTPCLERTIEHHQTTADILPKGHIKCPGCRQEAEASVEFVTLDQIGKCKPKLRILSLPVLCRLNQMSAIDNNKKQVVIFGHPGLVQVPNQVSAKDLYRLLRPLMPFTEKDIPHLALVNAQGKGCSRCIFNLHCHGCIRILPEDQSDILLQISDTIAITYTNLNDSDLEMANRNLVLHESMNRPRIKEKLSLNDCLEAFSRTEELDETNPWYCPMCRKNKCATKTLSVWRFPDYLIIYLKRFVFTNAGAIKLEKDVQFQVNDLDLTPYLSGPLQSDSRPVFNMYGCVCHFGSVYGGHYTAFSKHLGTNQWNYYDDSSISEHRVPGDSPGDHSSAYVLFYQRAGSKQDNLIPLLNRKCRAFALNNNNNNEEASKDQDFDDTSETPTLLNNTTTTNKPEQMLDEDEDESPKPDISQIIRSLDTPPPS